MKSKNYKLFISNNKLILKEEVTQSVSIDKFKSLLRTTVGETFKFVTTTAAQFTNMFIYAVASILTMFSSDEIKDRINDRYRNRRKEIFEKYENIFDTLKVQEGHDAAYFLFSPSLYFYEKITDNLDKKGIISGNILSFIDDPYGTVIGVVPGLKTTLFGAEKTTKEEINSIYGDYTAINRQQKLIEQIKKLGVGNLQQMLKDKSLSREQRISIENLIEYVKKNESPNKIKTSTLKIGKVLILEEQFNKEDAVKLVNAFISEVKKNFSIITEKVTESDKFKESFNFDKNELSKTINDYKDNNIDLAEYYKQLSEILKVFVIFLDLIKLSIEKNKMEGVINFQKKAAQDFKNITVKKEFEKEFENGKTGIMNFIENFVNLSKDNKEQDNISALKSLVSATDLSSEINKINSELQKTIKLLSSGGEVSKNLTEFSDNIENLIEKGLLEEKEKETIDRLNNMTNETQKTFDNLLTKVKDLIEFFNNIKV